MKKGGRAIDFTLQDSQGTPVNLKAEAKQNNILLLFFPLAFSEICTSEMCTIRNNLKLYNSLSANVIGISVDSYFTLREFKKSNNLNFLLLSDFNREVSKKYGTLNEDYFGMKGVSNRAAFVINRDFVIEYAEILDDSDNQPDFKAIINVLGNLRSA